MPRQPNIVFVFGDQWRGSAFGYASDPNVQTPAVDAFAGESVRFVNAVAGCPVCSPYRASLMSGQYPLTHGVFVNDQSLYDRANATFLAEAFAAGGYDTAYIGKWHIDGHGRREYIPAERRLGFQFWRGCECTHDYNHSLYYGDSPKPEIWPGYDADAQTDAACDYFRSHDGDKPFLMMLSWGPPHNPYHTAPEAFRAMYKEDDIKLPPNVPPEHAQQAREEMAGYYAHCSALDACFARLLKTLDETALADNTIVVFTSDHGDMLGCHGNYRKQNPYAESNGISFMVRDPRNEKRANDVTVPIDAPDVMPTLLGLCGLAVPETVEGRDLSPAVHGRPVDNVPAVLACYCPFGNWHEGKGGREYRGLRTDRYTYVRTLNGPWLLFDNADDPYQMNNLIGDPAAETIRQGLDVQLNARLADLGDEFKTGRDYLAEYNVALDKNGRPLHDASK